MTMRKPSTRGRCAHASSHGVCFASVFAALVLVAFVWLAVCPRAFADADPSAGAAASPPAAPPAETFEITVFQTIEAQALSSGAIQTWNYVLEGTRADCPLPDGALDGRYRWQMTGDERRVLVAGVPFAPGVYSYRMHQERPDPVPAGHTLDARVYTVDLYVWGDGSPYTLVCSVEGEGKVADPGWTIGFRPSASGKPAAHDGAGGTGVGAASLAKWFPKTGDVSMLVVIAAGACALAGIVFVVIARRRKRHRAQDVQEELR